MRIAIVGSRGIDDKDYMGTIDHIIAPYLDHTGRSITILSGGAKGVDSMAKEYAGLRGYDFIMFKPYHLLDNRVKFEPKYFFARNRQIVDNADLVIAIWDGESRGTKHTIDYAKKRRVDVIIL